MQSFSTRCCGFQVGFVMYIDCGSFGKYNCYNFSLFGIWYTRIGLFVRLAVSVLIFKGIFKIRTFFLFLRKVCGPVCSRSLVFEVTEFFQWFVCY